MSVILPMTYYKIILVYLISLLSTSIVGQEIASVVARADSFFDSGNYENALLEYQRAIFFSDESTESSNYRKTAQCYYFLNDYQRAKDFFSKAIKCCVDDSLKNKILFQSVTCDFESHNFYNALNELNALSDPIDQSLNREKMFYLGISYWGLNKYDMAFESFINSLQESEFEKRQQLIILKNESRNLIRPGFSILPLMSILIPGSGQILAGEIKEGIISTLLCGGIATVGIKSVYTFNNGVAILYMWPWFLRYYIGGVRQTQTLVQQNRAVKRDEVFNLVLDILSI